MWQVRQALVALHASRDERLAAIGKHHHVTRLNVRCGVLDQARPELQRPRLVHLRRDRFLRCGVEPSAVSRALCVCAKRQATDREHIASMKQDPQLSFDDADETEVERDNNEHDEH
jgi:hypothetical protein